MSERDELVKVVYTAIPNKSRALVTIDEVVDPILASDWLAKVKAKAAAEENERLADMASSVFDRSFFLRRADRITEELASQTVTPDE